MMLTAMIRMTMTTTDVAKMMVITMVVMKIIRMLMVMTMAVVKIMRMLALMTS